MDKDSGRKKLIGRLLALLYNCNIEQIDSFISFN